MNPSIRLVLRVGRIFIFLPQSHTTVTVMRVMCVWKRSTIIKREENINKLFTVLGSVSIVKN